MDATTPPPATPGSTSRSGRTRSATRSSPPPSTPASHLATSKRRPATPIRGRQCDTTARESCHLHRGRLPRRGGAVTPRRFGSDDPSRPSGQLSGASFGTSSDGPPVLLGKMQNHQVAMEDRHGCRDRVPCLQEWTDVGSSRGAAPLGPDCDEHNVRLFTARRAGIGASPRPRREGTRRTVARRL